MKNQEQPARTSIFFSFTKIVECAHFLKDVGFGNLYDVMVRNAGKKVGQGGPTEANGHLLP